jgi:type IV pilus assembly protein PilO
MAKSFNDLPIPAQAAIFIVGAIVLAGVVFWLYVLPLKAQRDNLQTQVTQLHAENLRNRAFEQERTEYLNRIAQLQKQLETLRSIVPDEQATDAFMKMVFEDGGASNINIRTFIPQALVTHDMYMEMPFNLRLDGTYYSLLSFFDRLAHEQRIVSVTGLNLGTPEGGGMGSYTVAPSETVGANCIVSTYFNRPQPPPGPPKGAPRGLPRRK